MENNFTEEDRTSRKEVGRLEDIPQMRSDDLWAFHTLIFSEYVFVLQITSLTSSGAQFVKPCKYGGQYSLYFD